MEAITSPSPAAKKKKSTPTAAKASHNEGSSAQRKRNRNAAFFPKVRDDNVQVRRSQQLKSFPCPTNSKDSKDVAFITVDDGSNEDNSIESEHETETEHGLDAGDDQQDNEYNLKEETPGEDDRPGGDTEMHVALEPNILQILNEKESLSEKLVYVVERIAALDRNVQLVNKKVDRIASEQVDCSEPTSGPVARYRKLYIQASKQVEGLTITNQKLNETLEAANDEIKEVAKENELLVATFGAVEEAVVIASKEAIQKAYLAAWVERKKKDLQ